MDDWLAQRFEENRTRLRAVAYRMLGSLSEADDAVQEAWLHMRHSRAAGGQSAGAGQSAGGGQNAGGVANLDGWLTTVVARVCLDMLRSRRARREHPLDTYVPDPIVSAVDGIDPEQEALLADSVGLALLVVLDTLAPAERLAFVLHDVFAVPFDEIAAIVGRSATAVRQIASRARRRVQQSATVPDADLSRQREVVDAFFAAARGGDIDGLVAVLDPGVLLRADHGAVPAGRSREVRGARAVARGALAFSGLARFAQPVLVNGAPGVVATVAGQPFSVMGFTVAGGRIVEIDILADPARLRRLDMPVLNDR